MNIYSYLIDLPQGVHEMVTPCMDGFTIYIDAGLSYEQRMKAYRHAMWHILHDDFSRSDVQEIETEAHMEAI